MSETDAGLCLDDDLDRLLEEWVLVGVEVVVALPRPSSPFRPRSGATSSDSSSSCLRCARALLHDQRDLLLADVRALEALETDCAERLEEHVALAEQRLGPGLVEDDARVGLARHGEGDPRRDVGLDHAGDDVDRRSLSRKDEMDADGARLLGQADDGVAATLTEQRDEILERWLDAVQQPFHYGRKEHAVADHIPALFDALTGLLRTTTPRWVDAYAPLEDIGIRSAAQSHSRVRAEQGMKSADVVVEFRLLRQEIWRALRASIPSEAPTDDVVAAEILVNDALDGAMTQGLTALNDQIDRYVKSSLQRPCTMSANR